MGTKEVWVTAPFVCKKGKGEEMKKYLRVLIQGVRKEHGCLFDDCMQDANNPDVFMFVEHWASTADFEAHVAESAVAPKKWRDEAGHLIAVPANLQFTVNHFKSIWPD